MSMIPLLRRSNILRPSTRALRSIQASTEACSHQPYKARRDRTLTATIIVLGFIPIFTFGLGTWQIQRLQWKVALIEELEEKLQREPMPLPNRINLSALPEFSWRKVLLRGRWDNDHTMLVGPRVRDGTLGYHLVVPLVRPDGSTVLVDRGFVSKKNWEAGARPNDNGEEVEVLGVLRRSQTRNSFTPDNKPGTGEWFWTDVDAMAQYAGGDGAGVQPVFLEELFEGHAGDASWRLSHGIPIGRPPSVDLRNQHATYAVTWYSLSLFTAGMFVHLLRKGRTSRSQLPR